MVGVGRESKDIKVRDRSFTMAGVGGNLGVIILKLKNLSEKGGHNTKKNTIGLYGYK